MITRFSLASESPEFVTFVAGQLRSVRAICTHLVQSGWPDRPFLYQVERGANCTWLPQSHLSLI